MDNRFIDQHPDSSGGGEEFANLAEAAEFIAQFWQGDRPEDLVEVLQGRTVNNEIYGQAIDFAKTATAEYPDVQAKLTIAVGYLWRDYEAGSGVHLLEEAESTSRALREIRQRLEVEPDSLTIDDLAVIAKRDTNPDVKLFAINELARRAKAKVI